jgi:hypothetical protein
MLRVGLTPTPIIIAAAVTPTLQREVLGDAQQ